MRVLRRLARLFDRARRSILRDGHLWASIAAIVHVHRRKKRSGAPPQEQTLPREWSAEHSTLSTDAGAAAAAAGRAPARPGRGPAARAAAPRRSKEEARGRPPAEPEQPEPGVAAPRGVAPDDDANDLARFKASLLPTSLGVLRGDRRLAGRSGRRLARGRPLVRRTRDGARARGTGQGGAHVVGRRRGLAAGDRQGPVPRPRGPARGFV